MRKAENRLTCFMQGTLWLDGRTSTFVQTESFTYMSAQNMYNDVLHNCSRENEEILRHVSTVGPRQNRAFLESIVEVTLGLVVTRL
jgi:hypothetical protein